MPAAVAPLEAAAPAAAFARLCTAQDCADLRSQVAALQRSVALAEMTTAGVEGAMEQATQVTLLQAEVHALNDELNQKAPPAPPATAASCAPCAVAEWQQKFIAMQAERDSVTGELMALQTQLTVAQTQLKTAQGQINATRKAALFAAPGPVAEPAPAAAPFAAASHWFQAPREEPAPTGGWDEAIAKMRTAAGSGAPLGRSDWKLAVAAPVRKPGEPEGGWEVAMSKMRVAATLEHQGRMPVPHERGKGESAACGFTWNMRREGTRLKAATAASVADCCSMCRGLPERCEEALTSRCCVAYNYEVGAQRCTLLAKVSGSPKRERDQEHFGEAVSSVRGRNETCSCAAMELRR